MILYHHFALIVQALFNLQHAQSIYQQVVVTKIMPMNNATGITDAERALIKQWFEAGAKTE